MKDQNNPPHPGAHAPRPHAHPILTIRKGGDRSPSGSRRPRPFSRSGRPQRSAGGSSRPDRPPPSSYRWPCLGTPCAAHRCRERDRRPSARSSATESQTGRDRPDDNAPGVRRGSSSEVMNCPAHQPISSVAASSSTASMPGALVHPRTRGPGRFRPSRRRTRAGRATREEHAPGGRNARTGDPSTGSDSASRPARWRP
jgi:hypothetical protein